jgi:hypothetical protein
MLTRNRVLRTCQPRRHRASFGRRQPL